MFVAFPFGSYFYPVPDSLPIFPLLSAFYMYSFHPTSSFHLRDIIPISRFPFILLMLVLLFVLIRPQRSPRDANIPLRLHFSLHAYISINLLHERYDMLLGFMDMDRTLTLRVGNLIGLLGFRDQ
jgi:hypothetical protein